MPEHLQCMISGDLLEDPVMIESGQTYERAVIQRYFEIQKERADQEMEDEDFDEDDYLNFFKCPITM